MDWFTTCSAFAQTHQLPEESVRVLWAFGKEEPTSQQETTQPLEASHFSNLLKACHQQVPTLSEKIVQILDGEVDQDQAKMFARRWQAVYQRLQTIEPLEARLYQVGMVKRLEDILQAPGPRALRIRALADYYYSHAALLYHHTQNKSGHSLEKLIQQADWEKLAQGIEYTQITGQTEQGPVYINVLRCQRARLSAMDCRTQEGHFPELVQKSGAIAGISGGFFLYSEPDITLPSQRTDPVGLLIHESSVQGPPVFHRAALCQLDGQFSIQAQGMKGVTIQYADTSWTVKNWNTLEGLGEVPLVFNRAWGKHSPENNCESIAFVGKQIVQVHKGSQEIPLAGFVLVLPKDTSASAQVGTSVLYKLPQAYQMAMAGGPLLVNDGQVKIDLESEDFRGSAPPITFSSDETFDQNLLPRMAAGLTSNGTLVLAAIDGRNFLQAPGMTLHQTGHLMKRLGCQTVMNLDGGSSKRMIIKGQVVDIPSTEVVDTKKQRAKVRPVHTGILIYPE